MAYNKIFYFSENEDLYITKVPALPGCVSDGKTIDESLKNADELIVEWIDIAKEKGWDIPDEDYPEIESSNPSSIDVAAYILNHFDAVDTWFLQKMVYYCQAWCLGIYKHIFINDTFQDYANGPVNKLLLNSHKGKRIVHKKDYPITHMFTLSEIRHMNNIIAGYEFEDGDTLRKYTHQEDPWRLTRGNIKDGEKDNRNIPNEFMMNYYHN